MFDATLRRRVGLATNGSSSELVFEAQLNHGPDGLVVSSLRRWRGRDLDVGFGRDAGTERFGLCEWWLRPRDARIPKSLRRQRAPSPAVECDSSEADSVVQGSEWNVKKATAVVTRYGCR